MAWEERRFGKTLVRVWKGEEQKKAAMDLPVLEITLDKPTALADGQDAITLSFSVHQPDGKPVDLKGDFKIILRDGAGHITRLFLVSISGGSGNYRIKSRTPGRFQLLPGDFKTVRLISPVFFDFVEPASEEIML